MAKYWVVIVDDCHLADQYGYKCYDFDGIEYSNDYF